MIRFIKLASLGILACMIGMAGWRAWNSPPADHPPARATADREIAAEAPPNHPPAATDPEVAAEASPNHPPAATDPRQIQGPPPPPPMVAEMMGVAGEPKSYSPEEINPDDFVLPPDKGAFTREEWKRVRDAPGVKFVRMGPTGSPLHQFVRFVVEPYDDHQFRVKVWLTEPATREIERLAEEARQKLEAERPENPRRANIYPNWTSVVIPPWYARPEQPAVPLVHSGWSMLIRKVDPLPDGWTALVEVKPIVRTEYYEEGEVLDKHFELYSCKNGKLTLLRDDLYEDRTRDPAEGIHVTIRFNRAN